MHLHPLDFLADFSVSGGGFSFLFEPPSGLSFSRFSITVLACMGRGAFVFNTLSFVTRLACYITPDLRREDEAESHFYV